MDSSPNNEPLNKNLELLLRKHSKNIKAIKEIYIFIIEYISGTPLRIKILNVILFFSLTLIFTYGLYNLPLSIFFALVTSFFLLFFGKMYSILFLALYITLIIKVINLQYIYRGNPIAQTDIIKNKVPYNCTSGGLSIASDTLPQDLAGGYYTYSFWIFINGNNNYNDSGVDWSNYRYREWKSIFYRGNPMNSNGDLSSLIQFPGFWLTPVFNNMVIAFQTGGNVERIEIDNIQFNTWVNFTVVIESKSIFVYINGKLDRTLNLQQNASIMNNYGLYITNDIATNSKKKSGFPGYLAELICYNFALSPSYISNSYSYYKKILDKYQKKLDRKNNNYALPRLITNSDYLCNSS